MVPHLSNMKNTVRFRFNANGCEWFNPTTRKWIVADNLDLIKLIENVTKDYPRI